MCGQRRENHLVFQAGKKGCPERIILVDVQNAGNADGSANRLLAGQRLIPEEPAELVLIHIRDAVVCFLKAKSSFTAVSGNELSAVTEMVDSEPAVVAAPSAVLKCCGEGQVLHFLKGEHGGRPTFVIALSGNQSRSEGAHDAGNVRTDDAAAGNLLECAKNGVVVEGTALNDDILSELCRRRHLHDLEQRILDDGIGKACGDIGDLRALLLRLLDAGVHKHRAACAQINRIFGKEGCLCEILYGIVERFGKGFNEGAAPGGAGFVQCHGIYGAVPDPDALHVLSADVENAVDVRIEVGGSVIVCNGFHLAAVQLKGSLHQGFSIAGGAAACDFHLFRHQPVEFCDAADGRMNGRTVVGGIKGPEKLAVFADERKLGGCGACIDAEKSLSLIGGKIFFLYLVVIVAGTEALIILF